jgi:copper transport protein
MKALCFTRADTIYRVPTWWVALFIVLFAIGGVRPVLAHGYLLRSIPEDRAVLERAPARLQYWFSEPLEPDFSSLTVRDQNGNVIAMGGVADENPSLLTVRLPGDMPDGAYIVDMRLAFASDGHVIAQSRVFFIGQEVSGVTGEAASNQANFLEVVWRAITLASTMLLFGVFTLYTGVLIPAWGNPAYRAGLLPPRVMHRLSWIMGAALIAALFGNILALVQQSMAFFSADIGQVFSGGLWSVTRAGTRFGDLWTARMLLLGLVGAAYGGSLYFREEQPENVRPFWTASAWGMALVIGTFSAGSHAAGSTLLPWVGILVDWLHGLAVGLWVGGLAALVIVLPSALAPYQGDERRLALLAVLRRFSRLATACLLIVITTGIYSAFNWLYKPPDLVQTTYGSALVVKLILVGGLLLVGLGHYLALRPERYQRWTAIIQRTGSFIPTLRLEVGLALLILVSVGWLSATPVPIPDTAESDVPPPSATQTIGDQTITMMITPGGPGVNTYDIAVMRDGQPVDDIHTQVQFVSPARDWRGRWLPAESAGDGLYVAAGDEITQPGEWWALVDVTQPDGTVERAAFDWTISAEASIQESRKPTLLNWLALAGVLAAVGWTLYPSARGVYRRLDLSPATVTVAVGAVVATVFLGIVGFVVVNNTQAQYEAELNPLPTLVNTVLPDAASLERGRRLYETACTGWTDDTSALRTLVGRLERTRDEELFIAVRDGGQSLPACAAMTDTERWNVVNTIRGLR